MKAGALRHRVTLQDFGEVVDPATGYRTKIWRAVASDIPAEVAPLSGREYLAAAATQSAVTARITMRWRPGVTAQQRIVHGDAIYDIESVLPDAKSGREHLTLMCSTGVNDG